MKRSLLLMLVCLAALKPQAQTLNKGDVVPVENESFRVHGVKNAAAINPGGSGSGQTWNLTNAVFSADTYSRYDMVKPSATPYHADYPGATVAARAYPSYDTSFVLYWYYKDSANVFLDLGSNRDFITFINSNAECMLSYPMNLGDSTTDDFSFTSEAFSTTNRYRGRSVLNYDGKGQLDLPYGSYMNVFRLKQTTWQVNINTPTDTMRTVKYRWYKPGKHWPLFELTSYTESGGFTSSNAVILSASSNNAVEKLVSKNNLSLYPNPASSELSLESFSGALCGVEVYNMLGEHVLSGSYSGNKATLNVSSLPAGAYVVKALHTGGNISTQTLTISR